MITDVDQSDALSRKNALLIDRAVATAVSLKGCPKIAELVCA
jgi:hypothetical protein